MVEVRTETSQPRLLHGMVKFISVKVRQGQGHEFKVVEEHAEMPSPLLGDNSGHDTTTFHGSTGQHGHGRVQREHGRVQEKRGRVQRGHGRVHEQDAVNDWTIVGA